MGLRSVSKFERIEQLFMMIIYCSLFSCLARTDFNFAFTFASYYLWYQRSDEINTTLIMILNVVTCVFDLIWIITVSYIWSSNNNANPDWRALNGIHTFVILTSVLTLIFKVILLVFLSTFKKEQEALNNNVDQQQQQQQYQQFDSNQVNQNGWR